MYIHVSKHCVLAIIMIVIHVHVYIIHVVQIVYAS